MDEECQNFIYINEARTKTKVNTAEKRTELQKKLTKDRKWTMAKEERKKGRASRATKKQEVLEKRIVNLSSIRLTPSETSILQKGLNFCPTPPPHELKNWTRTLTRSPAESI